MWVISFRIPEGGGAASSESVEHVPSASCGAASSECVEHAPSASGGGGDASDRMDVGYVSDRMDVEVQFDSLDAAWARFFVAIASPKSLTNLVSSSFQKAFGYPESLTFWGIRWWVLYVLILNTDIPSQCRGTQPLVPLPGPQTYVCVITSRWTVNHLESQEEDAAKCILFFKSMSCLGQIRSQRRDETWSDSLWQTFFFHLHGRPLRSQWLKRSRSRLVVVGNFN
jgi:hypothetical protein